MVPASVIILALILVCVILAIPELNVKQVNYCITATFISTTYPIAPLKYFLLLLSSIAVVHVSEINLITLDL